MKSDTNIFELRKAIRKTARAAILFHAIHAYSYTATHTHTHKKTRARTLTNIGAHAQNKPSTSARQAQLFCKPKTDSWVPGSLGRQRSHKSWTEKRFCSQSAVLGEGSGSFRGSFWAAATTKRRPRSRRASLELTFGCRTAITLESWPAPSIRFPSYVFLGPALSSQVGQCFTEAFPFVRLAHGFLCSLLWRKCDGRSRGARLCLIFFVLPVPVSRPAASQIAVLELQVGKPKTMLSAHERCPNSSSRFLE